jgi:hypothetical protein
MRPPSVVPGLHDPITPWLRARRAPAWLAPAVHATVMLAALYGLYEILQPILRHWENDAFGFYTAWENGLYDRPWLERYAYVYSPAFAQAIQPATERLSWPTFSDAWNTMQLGALVATIGPVWAALAAWFYPIGDPNAVYGTLRNGNPMILLTLLVVAGHRWPWTWAGVSLMKVTPGVGLLWFAVRREWRNLGIALGATAGIAAISAALAPELWGQWISLLADASGADTLARNEPILPLPLLVRLPVAVLLIAWGGLTDRYWTVPIGAMLALPAIQVGGFAVMLGALAFTRLPWIPRLWAAR